MSFRKRECPKNRQLYEIDGKLHYDAEIREEMKGELYYFSVWQVEIHDDEPEHRGWMEWGAGFEGNVPTFEQAEAIVIAAFRALVPEAF